MKYLFGLLALFSLNAQAAPLLCNIDPAAPCLADTGDELFSVSDIDGIDDDITSFILGRGAAFSNSFGLYNPNDATQTLQIHDGTTASGFASGVVINYDGLTSTYSIEGAPLLSLTLADAFFGLYIDTGSTRYYSQSALNGGEDHMLSFATEGAGGSTNGFDYVFAWEDLPGGGDGDYTDIVVGCIDCTAKPVPVPATLALMGLGLAGLGFRRV